MVDCSVSVCKATYEIVEFERVTARERKTYPASYSMKSSSSSSVEFLKRCERGKRVNDGWCMHPNYSRPLSTCAICALTQERWARLSAGDGERKRVKRQWTL